jgi:hypothetical protein
MTLETPSSAQIEVYRQKARDGTITTDELKQAIAFIREGRITAAAKPKSATGTKRSSGSTKQLSTEETDAMLKELEDL